MPLILPKYPLRPAGYFEIVGDGARIEGETLQCGHCGCHFAVHPGSGVQRGFCLKCNKVTCGKPECLACNPSERQIEVLEERAKCR